MGGSDRGCDLARARRGGSTPPAATAAAAPLPLLSPRLSSFVAAQVTSQVEVDKGDDGVCCESASVRCRGKRWCSLIDETEGLVRTPRLEPVESLQGIDSDAEMKRDDEK